MTRTSSATVELTAAVDPIAAWADLFTRTTASLSGLGNLVTANPAPILEQVVANWAVYGQTYSAALQTAGAGLNRYLSALPTNLQMLSNQLASGDMDGAASTLVNAIVNSLAFSVGFPMLNVFSIPTDITQNIANVVKSFQGFGGVVVAVGVSALSMTGGTILAAGANAQAVVDAISDGDPLGAASALLAMPANVSDAFINGYTIPTGGFAPGLLSVAAPPPPGSPPNTPGRPDGPLAALLKSRLTIARAIGWEPPATTAALWGHIDTAPESTALESPQVSTVPDAAATTMTLSTNPAPTAPKIEAAPQAAPVAALADPTATEAVTREPAKQATAPVVRESLVATPGKTGTLGTMNNPAATVASDVRDGISATAKKIGDGFKEALNKPEKKSATTSSSADKASDSGNSGDAE